MGHSKKFKNLHSIFKDKAKIIKAKFSITNHTTTSIQIAVLRATTRATQSPPHNHLISALVSLTQTTRHSASACISTIINRLHHHHEPNTYVTLKCLITLHYMITSGSVVLKEQLLFNTVSNTDLGFLNLTRFVDDTDMQSREFSFWAQWYACFLESNLSTSIILGCHVSLSKLEIEKKKEKLKFSLYMDLFKEVKSLISTIEEICKAPKSLHCQTNDIVYEVMRLVGEDYRMIQYHTIIRLNELSERILNFSTHEVNELTRYLERLASCKARLTELFVNRRRNESFWDLVTELIAKLVKLKEDRERKPLSWKMIEFDTELTRLSKQLISTSRPLKLLPLGKSNNWSKVDHVNLTFSMATV